MRSARCAILVVSFALLPWTIGAQAGGGTVRGRVTEAGTGTPLEGAQVLVTGTRQGAPTKADGRFVLVGVAPGAALLRVVRLGYQPLSRTVQVVAGGDVTADFSLAEAVKTLDAIVTTATGEQSRKSYGNVVATLNLDSLAEKAAATNVNELLQGRVAGVQVIQGSGQTGTSGPDDRGGEGGERRALVLAITAGAVIGVFYSCLGQASAAAGVMPLVVGRATSVAGFLAAGTATWRRRQRWTIAIPRSTIGLVSAAGLVDTIANVCYLLAVTGGLLSVIAPLSSLYPASTVLLARVVLHERLRPVHVAGLALAAAAIVLMTAG